MHEYEAVSLSGPARQKAHINTRENFISLAGVRRACPVAGVITHDTFFRKMILVLRFYDHPLKCKV